MGLENFSKSNNAGQTESNMSEKEQTPEQLLAQQEDVKFAISAKIEEKIRAVLAGINEDNFADFFETNDDGESKHKWREGEIFDKLISSLKEQWPENNDLNGRGRKPTFYIKLDAKIPHSDDDVEVVKVVFERGEDSDSRQSDLRLRIGLGGIIKSKNFAELMQQQEDLLDTVYHETEHLYNFGTEVLALDAKGQIEYLSDEGEISAFARQFARRYLVEYPADDEIDITKIVALANEQKADGGPKDWRLRNYFYVFAQPSAQEKYREFGDLKKVNEQITQATQRHFASLKQRSNLIK